MKNFIVFFFAGCIFQSANAQYSYQMNGMQHVVKGTKYPAVICIGGWNDPRVVAWQPGKFAAAMKMQQLLANLFY